MTNLRDRVAPVPVSQGVARVLRAAVRKRVSMFFMAVHLSPLGLSPASSRKEFNSLPRSPSAMPVGPAKKARRSPRVAHPWLSHFLDS